MLYRLIFELFRPELLLRFTYFSKTYIYVGETNLNANFCTKIEFAGIEIADEPRLTFFAISLGTAI